MFDLFISGTVLARRVSVCTHFQALVSIFTGPVSFSSRVFVRQVIGSLGIHRFSGRISGRGSAIGVHLPSGLPGWARGMLLTGFIVQIIALFYPTAWLPPGFL